MGESAFLIDQRRTQKKRDVEQPKSLPTVHCSNGSTLSVSQYSVFVGSLLATGESGEDSRSVRFGRFEP